MQDLKNKSSRFTSLHIDRSTGVTSVAKRLRTYKVRKLEQYKNNGVEDIPDLLRLKMIQDLWDSEEKNEKITD